MTSAAAVVGVTGVAGVVQSAAAIHTHPAHIASRFIGCPAIAAIAVELLVLSILYFSLPRALGCRLVAPWLRIPIFAYLGCALAVTIIAAVLPIRSAQAQGAALLAAMLGVMGTALSLQQLNYSLPRQRECSWGLCLRVMVLLLTTGHLLSMAGVWSLLTAIEKARGIELILMLQSGTTALAPLLLLWALVRIRADCLSHDYSAASTASAGSAAMASSISFPRPDTRRSIP